MLRSGGFALSYEEVLAVEAKKRMLAGKADPMENLPEGTEDRAPQASEDSRF